MSHVPHITLYDTPLSQSNGWAPSIWRIRLILNYKNLPYRTKWIEFPDLDRTMRSIGAPATSRRPDGRSVYTLPVISDPLRSPNAPIVLSNASTIAEHLEKHYPARPVYPPGSKALQTLFVHYLVEVFSKPLLPIMIPISAQKLSERSQAHFFTSGQQPHAVQASIAERELSWTALRSNFDFLAAVLDKNSGAEDGGRGVLASGDELTYADFSLCAILIWIETVSPQDVWPRIKSWNEGRWNALLTLCRPYMDVI